MGEKEELEGSGKKRRKRENSKEGEKKGIVGRGGKGEGGKRRKEGEREEGKNSKWIKEGKGKGRGKLKTYKGETGDRAPPL